ncbi:MAG: NTP transferase domain-containing protein [Deltaproteobacteria bacterium]|nr:NTP transferase domain-containing protein [Deltaproteobacteria bacterium]
MSATRAVPQKAVLLAAGAGTRLEGETLPKPLVPILGVPLIVRALVQFQRAGVEEAIIVVGHRGDEIRAALAREPRLKLRLTFVDNPAWRKKNGVSVLAAREAVGNSEFYLSMSDHVFEPTLVAGLKATPCPADGAVLAIDRKIDDVYDMDDAMKVVVADDGRVSAIAKDLRDFNAIDTGLFRATPGLFVALEAATRDGDCSLADGCRALAGAGKMATVDIGRGRWQDVDTPGSKPIAEKMLLDGLRKPLHDGVVSSNINRHVSLAITRRLAKTNVTPNQISAVCALLAIAAAVLVAQGGYFAPLLGAFLFQWNSIIDGVDGEIARVKFLGSKTGEWVDTLVDDGSNIVFFVGMTVGAVRETGDNFYAALGGVTLALSLAATALMYRRLIQIGSGDLNLFAWEFDTKADERRSTNPLSKLKLLMKKDFFVFMFFVLALFGVLRAGFWLYVVGMPIVFVAVVLQTVQMQRIVRFPSQPIKRGGAPESW